MRLQLHTSYNPICAFTVKYTGHLCQIAAAQMFLPNAASWYYKLWWSAELHPLLCITLTETYTSQKVQTVQTLSTMLRNKSFNVFYTVMSDSLDVKPQGAGLLHSLTNKQIQCALFGLFVLTIGDPMAQKKKMWSEATQAGSQMDPKEQNRLWLMFSV